ncbi:MAG: AIPR family protein [Oscillospiraceae bacterium]|jgi:hypothetical protein|nr:AIPR family protein [Oscillospiraceae bacterium]
MYSAVIPFLDEHVKEFELTGSNTENFEHLINYITVRDYTSRYFDPAVSCLGKPEVGIDGASIIVNDVLVTSEDEVKSIFEDGKKDRGLAREITVSLIFTQSKTSESLDTGDLSLFFNSVDNFINGGTVNASPKSKEIQRIINYIFNHPTQLARNPDCFVFFAYLGKYNHDAVAEEFKNDASIKLESTNKFGSISVNIYDATKIISMCRAIKNSVEKSITMNNCAVLPQIDRIREAFIGTVSCNEYVKLISNDDGILMSHLFEDNVRYFQGYNQVNSQIQSTLRNTDKQQAFSVLNNGVTIVAQEIRRISNTFVLKNFQVVNGCQTSYILYDNRSFLQDDAYIVVKLISTTDKIIVDDIVQTTNRQTPVLTEAFETLREFHKDLENAYASYEPKYRLYYERRSKQYDSSDISKNKIVSFPSQTAAYVAVFLNEPQSTHRYYGELLTANKQRMYQDDDVLEQYCVSSMLVYLVDKYLRTNNISTRYKKYRFHLAMMLRLTIDSSQLPKANSKNMKKLCNTIYEKIKENDFVVKSMRTNIDLLNDIIAKQPAVTTNGNDISRTRNFTQQILERFNGDMNTPAKEILPLEIGNVFECRVTGIGYSRAYVEILDYKESGFIYIGNITGTYIRDIESVLSIGQAIKAKIINPEPIPYKGYELSMLI